MGQGRADMAGEHECPARSYCLEYMARSWVNSLMPIEQARLRAMIAAKFYLSSTKEARVKQLRRRLAPDIAARNGLLKKDQDVVCEEMSKSMQSTTSKMTVWIQ